MSDQPARHNSAAVKRRWSEEALTPIAKEGQKLAAIVGRTLNDLPATIPKVQRDVAKLTAIRCYQRQALPGVMESLERLRAETDWNQPFLVCDADKGFDWRTAPVRRYAGFEDFYKRELEATWGEWAKLKSAWSDLVEHKITEEEFEDRRLGKPGGGAPLGNRNAVKNGNNPDTNRVVSLGQKGGDTGAYIRARLERDGHTELLEKIERGEVSAHAVAVQLGWRTHMVQHPATVEGFRKAIERHLTAAEREEIKEWL
jgi:hypothetical protein